MTPCDTKEELDAELATEFTFGTESQNTRWFCEVAERYNVQHYALAGSVFQVGLPDRMFICPDGCIRLIEFKRDARLAQRIQNQLERLRELSRMYPHEAAAQVRQNLAKYSTDLVESGVDWKQLNLRGAQHDMIMRATKVHTSPNCCVVVQGSTPSEWAAFRYDAFSAKYVAMAHGVSEILMWLYFSA